MLQQNARISLIGPAVVAYVAMTTAVASPAHEQDVIRREQLIPLLAAIQSTVLGDLQKERAARLKIEEAGVEWGTWYRIGPFRDQPPLLNWMENTASSFAYRFEAERDLHANHGAPLLEKTYRASNFPTTPDAVRR